MGYDRECQESFIDLADDFGIENPGSIEAYVLYYRILVMAKTLAHYSTAPECAEIASKLRTRDVRGDTDDEGLMAIINTLPEEDAS